MLGVATGLVLVVSLLAVDIWRRRTALDPESPLDVESGLPLPWAGYASSVFSLTALFGSYFAIYVLLGWTALVGLAVGSVLGLVWLDWRIAGTNAKSFDGFLRSRRFSQSQRSDDFYFILLSILLHGLAISELFILRDLAIAAFSMETTHATIFVVTIALVCYLYCLSGGYGALYRTDIVQYGFVLFMAIGLSSFAVAGLVTGELSFAREPLSPGSWAPMRLPILTGVLNFIVGSLTGCCYVIANPDVWKRVFLSAVTQKEPRRRRIALFLVAGFTPFLLLLPAAALLPPYSLSEVGPFDLFVGLQHHRFVLAVAATGMIASFMSSFDSSLLVAAHTSLTRVRATNTLSGLARFRLHMALSFTVIGAGTLALLASVGNPYLVAACLLGFFAVLGGHILGTDLLSRPHGSQGFPFLPILSIVGWQAFVLNLPDAVLRPDPVLVTAFPWGMALFLLFALRSRSDKHSSVV